MYIYIGTQDCLSLTNHFSSLTQNHYKPRGFLKTKSYNNNLTLLDIPNGLLFFFIINALLFYLFILFF